MSLTGWSYVITPRAARQLNRLSVDIRQRVIDALDRLVANPSQGDVRKLQGTSDDWRLRVGAWRVRFRRDEAGRTVVVLRVEPRGRAYRDC